MVSGRSVWMGSGDDVGGGTPGMVFHLQNFTGGGDQGRQVVGGGQVVTGNVRLVLFQIDAQRGALGAGTGEAHHQAGILMEDWPDRLPSRLRRSAIRALAALLSRFS